MAKIRKAVFRSGIVMLSLLAAIVLSSSVAQAQECIARASSPPMARATGITEAVDSIELLCRLTPAGTFGFGGVVLPVTTLSIELNTQVTNDTSAGVVMGLTYDGDLGDDDQAGTPSPDYRGDDKEELSSDGTTITWKLNTDSTDTNGDDYIAIGANATITIDGILANASALGAEADITAVVRVNGEAVHEGTLKLADVEVGLEVPEDKFEIASGLQCMAEEITATILFKEGFNSAFYDEGAIVLDLRGVPDDVTVTASMAGTGTALDPPIGGDNQVQPGDLAPVTLDVDSGVEVEEGVATVEISSTGTGQVIYTFNDEDGDSPELEGTDPGDAEWNTVELTFSWDAGGPPLDMGSVTVSFHPVTTDDDESPRYVSGPTMDVVEVEDCVSTLTFPFVTNMHGYDTGIAITNISTEAGACMLAFSGMEEEMEVMVMGESVETFGVSMMAPGFQGFVEATCEFRNAKGFAFISNGFGSMGGPSAAQGYLVAEEIVGSNE